MNANDLEHTPEVLLREGTESRPLFAFLRLNSGGLPLGLQILSKILDEPTVH